jgi:hypothetical protein
MKCCICGTVRNCGKYLNNIFKIMEQIGRVFEDYKIILYYDNSNDDTLSKLQNYSLLNNKMIYYVNTEEMLKYRTHRIAKGRNKCLELMRQNYNDYEYFIMIDCDDRCNYNINLNILKNYLNRNDWDGLSFNHPAGYYDTWALSKRPFVLSCHHFKDIGLGQRNITKLIKRTPKNKLIRCLSAFNGFSIYRTNKFIECWYDGRFRLDYFPKKLILENIIASGKIYLNQQTEDCEHRFFHVSAVKKHNARIMISPLCLFY